MWFNTFYSFVENDPQCTTNASADAVVGANDCGLVPDVVSISCSVSYRGNVAPSLHIRKNGIDVTAEDPRNTPNSNVFTNIVLQADHLMNNCTFTCSAKLVDAATSGKTKRSAETNEYESQPLTLRILRKMIRNINEILDCRINLYSDTNNIINSLWIWCNLSDYQICQPICVWPRCWGPYWYETARQFNWMQTDYVTIYRLSNIILKWLPQEINNCKYIRLLSDCFN